MAEVVGLVASVVQLAGAGLKLSQTLYQYADGVASADRRIKDIANEVKLTSFVIQELGTIFERDETANLISENAVKTANETIKECFAVFTELELKINKGKPGKMGRLMLPFKDNKIELLRSQIDKLKSTLELLMQVLIHAHQVSSEKYNREAEAKHREEIKQLLENKKQATKKYEESLRNFSISDGSTAVDDGDRSVQDEDDVASSSNIFNAAVAMGSTVNPDTLATCVDHVRSLLTDIETLQLALAKQVDGDDHSDHHQKAIGSYFLARSHLDSVLLGKSQANVTDTRIQQSLSQTSTHSSVSVSAAGYIPPLGKKCSAVLRDGWAEEKAKKAETKKVKQEEKRLRKLEREAEEAEAARAAETPEQKAEREANDKALFASLNKNTMFDQSQLTAPGIPELDGGYRTSSVSGKKKGIKGRTEVVSASLPEPGRTSSKVNTALQECSDNGFEVEVPERITSRRRRLWREEPRRREGSNAPERIKTTNRRDCRPSALSQPSQSPRDISSSSSLGYLSEEIELNSHASSVRFERAKRPPRIDEDKTEHGESLAVMASCDDSSETNEPDQRERAIARVQMSRRRRRWRERKDREEQEKAYRECKYDLNLQARRTQELHVWRHIIRDIGLTLPSDIEKLEMPELAEQSSTHAGKPAPADKVAADPRDAALYPIDDRVNQQMALLLAKEDQRSSPDSNCTFRIDLPEDRDACDFESSSSKKSKNKKGNKIEQTKPLVSTTRRHGSFETQVRSDSVSSRGSDVDKELERAKARCEERNMEYDRRREQERRKESSSYSPSTPSSYEVEEDVSMRSYPPLWRPLTRLKPDVIESDLRYPTRRMSKRHKSITEVDDYGESTGLGGLTGAATSNHGRSRSRSPIRARIDTAPPVSLHSDHHYRLPILVPCGDRSEKQEESMHHPFS